MPKTVCEDIMHAHDIQAVIDLTAADGVWAMACMRQRKPYVGVVLNERHGSPLTTWLELAVLRAMQDPHDPLYEPSLVACLKQTRADVGEDDHDEAEEPDDNPPAKRRKGAANKPATTHATMYSKVETQGNTTKGRGCDTRDAITQ